MRKHVWLGTGLAKTMSREKGSMNSMIRRITVLAFAAAILLLGATSTHADTLQVTLGGGVSGVLNLTATPNGGGVFLVTGLTGFEKIGNTTMSVGQLIPTNSSGVFWFPPPAGGFTFDNLIYPNSKTVFDNGGLLFTLLGSGGAIYENLYSVGTSLYMQSAYLNNGAPFPYDFSFVPVTVSVSAVATPEPSTLILCLAGLAVFAGLLLKHK
jgi:hypothetical protein